jgi:dipeptidyl aminopeptidase/acylaminoacyl peptidase
VAAVRGPARILCLVLVCAGSASARELKPADLFALRDIGEVQVSPDGATVLFTVSTRDPKANRTLTRLMRVAAAGGEPVAVLGAPEGAGTIRWSPDGRRVALLAGKFLWTLDPSTGARVQVCAYDRGNAYLAHAGNPLAWSPDGSRLAFAGTLEPRPAPQDPLVLTRLQYKTRTSFSDDRRTHIFVAPASGGAPRALTSGPYDEHSLDWSAGGEIVFLSNREADADAKLNYDIFAVNAETGALRRITETPGVEMSPRVSPDGRAIAYTATKRRLTTIDSVAEDAHVWVVPAGGGEGRELNAALDRRSSAPQWSPDGGAVLYTAADRGRTILYRVPAAGGDSAPVFERDGQAGPFSLARGGAIALGFSDPRSPREIWRIQAGEPRQLTRLNADALAGWAAVRPEAVRFRSFDGTEVEGWLYPARGGAKRAPLILSIHGGPHGMHGYGFNPAFQMYAERGYAVLAMNPRGSSGYGQKFSDGCLNDWGGGDYKDLMAGVDHVLQTHPEIDGERMGVMGGSYGGFMTNWIITQTPRFRAAVSIASLSNLISFYGTSLYQDLVHAEFSGFPWEGENFELLWKWSPLRHVKNAATPTLFLHGEQDNDVHITQAEEMFTALRRRGIEAALVRYPREGHGFREPKHQLDSLERGLAWMDRFLK